MRLANGIHVVWTVPAIVALLAALSAQAWAEPEVDVEDPAVTSADDDDPPPAAEMADDDGESADEEMAADDGSDAPGRLEAEMPQDEEEPADAAEASPQQTGAPAELPKLGHTLPAPLRAGDESASESDDVPLAAASLKGVRPGYTTREELHALWGEPKRVDKIAGGVRETYAIKSLQFLRVTIIEGVVQSLMMRLDKPAPIETAAKRLDVASVEPVDVADEQGQALGCVYPERGVLFGFTPRVKPPRVFQIVIEPVDAQPFLARAEKRLAGRYTDCQADLKRALELAPDNSRALGLQAELSLRTGAIDVALRSAEKAIELEPKEPEYRLSLAKILAAAGDHQQAIEQARGVVEWGKAPAEAVARAHLVWGDCLAASQERDYTEAIKHHTQAIKLAETLTNSPNALVRRAAKEVLLDAHLAVAHDIGWGRWKQKASVVPKWVARANAAAEDLVSREQGSSELIFRVHERTLAALAGIVEPPDASAAIRGTLEAGKKNFDAATDPTYRAHIAWRMGVALADAVEIEASRHRTDPALALGETALNYFERGEEAGKQLPTYDYLRGRLCYRMGAMYAIDKANHRQGVEWFEQAVPLLESPVPAAAVDCGKQGETFVSIAVSYWDVNKRPEALRLTNQGVKLMEQAASEGLLSKAALAIPYGNLASMYEQMGDAQAARKFSELAARQEETTAK